MQNNITIIIPARNCIKFIDECMESIFNQTMKNFDVKICFDNDYESLEYFKTTPYYKKVDTYITEERVYPYIIRNSLWDIVKTKHVLFFDADDIMIPEMIERIWKFEYINDMLRFGFRNFQDGQSIDTAKNSNMLAHGVFYTTKRLYERTGGFQPWLCGADTEFLERCQKNYISIGSIDDYLFYRRKHNNCLTIHPDTKMNGDLRNKYTDIIYENRKKDMVPLHIETQKTKIIKC